MKKGKIISIISAISIMMGMLPATYAENNKTVEIGDSGYILVDLKEKANCIGFADNGYTPETAYTVPDYLGVGRTGNTDGIDIIYNKIAMDNKKDENGFIYDNSGRPFMVNTSLDTPNFPLLGSGDYLNNQSFTIELDNQKLYEISFLADATYNVDAASFLMEVKYSDGTVLKDSDWVIKPRNANVDEVLGYVGVDAYIGFNYVYATDKDPDAALNSGIGFRPKNNKRDPLNVSYNFPVYTLKTDNTKGIESITIKQTGKYYGMAVLAMTLKSVTKADEIKSLIDSLPEETEINFGNYTEYKDTVEKISEEIEKNNITLDSKRNEKLKGITEKIENYENNPLEGINWFIDSLPEADEITEENCEEYLVSVNSIKEKLNGDFELTTERKEKFDAVSNAVELYYNQKTLKTFIDSLPYVDEITKSNYSEILGTLEKIQNLLDKSVTADDERIIKYNEIKEKINTIINTYNPYVTFDFSGSANAIVFGEYGLNLDDSNCRTPFYLGAKNSNETLSPYPTMILNKTAFENIKESDGLIYSKGKEIPFDINTNYGIILGSDAEDRLHSVTIPVKPGNYKNVSVAYAGTYDFEANQFEMKVEYTDGTYTIDPDWKIGSQQANMDNFSKYTSVADYYLIKYDSAKGQESAPYFERNDREYTKLRASDMYFPVITLETDVEKTVKCVSFKQTDTWRALAIIGITGELAPQDEIKSIIESKIKAVDRNNLAAEYENIQAIKNMLERYKDSIGAEEISGLSEFEEIYNEFSNSVVEIKECKTVTTLDETVTTVEFKNDIQQNNLNELITISLNGEVVNDYKMETISSKILKFSFKNDFDYNKEYKILISASLQSAVNSSFTLKNDYLYTFSPEAPFEIMSFEVVSENGEDVQNINDEKGKSIDVRIKLKNNSIKGGQKYGMTLCLYGENNKMIKVYLEQAELAMGAEKLFTYTLDIPETEGKYSLTCFVNDGYSTMKKIVRSISK